MLVRRLTSTPDSKFGDYIDVPADVAAAMVAAGSAEIPDVEFTVAPTGSPLKRPMGDNLSAALNGAKFRLPAGARIAYIGSSTVAKEVNVYGGVTLESNGAGMVTMARLRNPIFKFDHFIDAADSRGLDGDNYGIGGSTYVQQKAALPTIIARGYDALAVYTGTNELVSMKAPDAVEGIYNDLVKPALDAGIPVFWFTLTPRATSGVNSNANVVVSGDPILRKRLEFNQIIRRKVASHPSIALVDIAKAMEDPASSEGLSKAGLSDDGLHISPAGGYVGSIVIDDVFSRHIEYGLAYELSAGKVGNLFGNGLLSGTAGTVGGNCTGTLPDQVRGSLATGPANTTCAFSIVTDPREGNAIRATLAVNDTTAPEDFWLLFTPTPTVSNSCIQVPDAAGKWYRGLVIVYVQKGADLFQNIKVTVETRDSAGNALNRASVPGSLTNSVTEPFADGSANGQTFFLLTDPIQAPAGTTQINLKLTLQVSGTGTAAVEASCPYLREVPKPAFA